MVCGAFSSSTRNESRVSSSSSGFSRISSACHENGSTCEKIADGESPVFPSYMFVVLDINRCQWRSVNGTAGVASLIMQGEMPQPVPGGVVENLLRLTDQDGIVRFDCNLRQGQPVRVLAGPFSNAIGTLERLDANGRVCVLLDIMKGKVPTYLDRSALEAA
jgi:transcription antitermination factor NusG